MLSKKIKLFLIMINTIQINASCASICIHTLRNSEIISRQVETNLKAIYNVKLEVDNILNLLISPPPPNPPSNPPLNPSPFIPPFVPIPPNLPPINPPSYLLVFKINNFKILLILLLIILFIFVTITIILRLYKVLKICGCYKKKEYFIITYFNNKKKNNSSPINLV